METCVFTLCSMNYLAYAKTLGDSLIKFNPGAKFIIGLVDRIGIDIDLSEFKAFEIIEIEKINLPYLDEKVRNYDIVELNTSVKPSFFKYLLKTRENLQRIIYLDPDIEIFDELTSIYQGFADFDIILTPHMITPIIGKQTIDEQLILQFGLYNLGFLGVARSDSGFALLEWWENKLRDRCVRNNKNGLFLYQKWMDVVSILFDRVGILKHPGLNVAWWNLHERKITKKGERFHVNESWPLVFFHFGAMSLPQGYENDLSSCIVSLLERDYKNYLKDNNNLYWKNIKCSYTRQREDLMKASQEKKLASEVKSILDNQKLSVWEKATIVSYTIIKKIIPRRIKKKIRKVIRYGKV